MDPKLKNPITKDSNISNQGKSSKSSDSSKSQKFKYMLFVWNGKNAGATIKAQTLTKGYALDEYLQ